MISIFFLQLYSVLYALTLLFLLPHEYLKRPRDLRKRWLSERLGQVPSLPASELRTVWVHAVSVGEVIASVPFIHEMMKRYPYVRVVLTTVTDTGQRVAKERLSEAVAVHYIPFDLPFSIKRFIKTMNPHLYISIETEIWPNLFCLLKRAGIPVLIMNGRISAGSFKGYRKISFFIKRVLDNVDLFCMQEELYGERIKALGVPAERIRITGNFKFDIKIEEYRGEWVRQLPRPVILVGSTHEGEEEIVLDACKRLIDEIGDMTLIIAPRHPERFAMVEDVLKRSGVSYIKRSEISSGIEDQNCAILQSYHKTGKKLGLCVVLIDLIGELASLYSICDVAIIGGSFSNRGGHNPLEPAFWGKPILCGTDMSNFPFIDEFYKNGAALKTSRHSLYEDLKGLLGNDKERLNMAKRAKEIYMAKAGAIRRSVEALKFYFEFF